jgi:predicted metal-dependent phosphoesterase TrpH
VSRIQLRLDLHVHTKRSYDGFTTLEEAISAAKMRGLDGLAITDHDVTPLQLDSVDNDRGVTLIPGAEVSTKDGHVVALGISRPVRAGLPVDEAVDAIHDLNGVAIAAHPFSLLHGLGWNPKKAAQTDAIEVINANSYLFSYQTGHSRRLAQALRKPMTAGSDSHIPKTIGNAYTVVEAEETSLEAIIKAVAQGKTQPTGTPTPLLDKLSKTAIRVKSRFLAGKDPEQH